MKKILSIAIIAGLLAHLGAPVVAADREHQQIMADIRMLQEQTQQLAITLAALNDALKTINTALTTRLDQQAEATRKAFADQKLLVDNIGADLRVVRERADETNVRISSLEQELEALRTAIPLPAPVVPPDLSGDPNAQTLPPAPAPAVPSTAGLSPRRMYDQAVADYYAGQWTLAIEGFGAFLRTFPMSDLADDAQFLIGETYYQTGKYQEAVNAYNQVIQRYAGSNVAPDASYKRGVAQERLGNIDAARESWQQVVKSHPDSDAGRLAKQALDRIGAKRP